jgi:hypothetical protein
VAGQGKNQADGMLGGGYGVPCGCVDNDDAAPGGGVNVNIIHADTGPADDLELIAGGDDSGCNLGLAAYQQGFVITDDGSQLVWFQARADVNLGVLAQHLQACFRDGIGY